MATIKRKSRRDILIGLGGLGAVAWGWQWYLHRPAPFDFVPIKGLTGWQRSDGGAISGSAADAVFLGIGEDAPAPLPQAELCPLLFGTPPSRLAVFTDINCPNCRSLEAKLAQRDLTITFLQLPLLGEGSELAARIVIAVETLSGQAAAPPRSLRGTGRNALLRYHAAKTGIAPEAISAEADARRTDNILTRHRRAAETLGIYGTPAMVIGKTLVMGDQSAARLDRILAMGHQTCN